MTAKTTLASVMTGPGRLEVRELPVPEPAPDAGVLRVEACGVCGADVGAFARESAPKILGHEIVGVVETVGPIAAQRWGVAEGDRVVLEEYLPCGHCRFCRSSDFRSCLASDQSANPAALRYGSTPLAVDPGLWGGYSQYLFLHPNTVAHRLPDGVSPVAASLALPLGNGYQWAYLDGGVGPGDTVVVIGPGQQGLGCVIAAKEAGAGQIIVVGLRRDAERLRVAGQLGAHHALNGEDVDVLAAVREITNGELADVVIDTAAGSAATVSLSLDLVRKHGTVLFPAFTSAPLAGVPFYKISRKALVVRGVRGHSYDAVEWAIDLIATGRHRLSLMSSLEAGLADVAAAIRGTGGELDTPVIHATVTPFAD